MSEAANAIRALRDAGRTIAVAESLTGGILCAELTSIPGASVVFRGGIVAYATDLKTTLGEVSAEVIAEHGAVSAQVAEEMARGVRRLLTADLGVATTGVAGPHRQEDHPPGTVHVALAGQAGTQVSSFEGSGRISGGRQEVRASVVQEALRLIVRYDTLKD